MKHCSVASCQGAARSRGLCSLHYIRWYRYGDPNWVPARHWVAKPHATFLERFFDKVNTAGDCWLWTGQTLHAGYGGFSLNGKQSKAHRVIYEVMNGPIPPGFVIRHTCDTPACVRPNHLLTGTAADNSRDMVERFRNLRGEAHPRAKLREKDVLAIRDWYRTGVTTHKEIAERYGVSAGLIGALLSGRIWKHV